MRKAMQQHYLDLLANTYKDTNLVILNLTPWEVKGMERIAGISQALFLTP
jgi:anion-transporting  ArsA/GET3 family ATPase